MFVFSQHERYINLATEVSNNATTCGHYGAVLVDKHNIKGKGCSQWDRQKYYSTILGSCHAEVDALMKSSSHSRRSLKSMLAYYGDPISNIKSKYELNAVGHR